MVVRTDEGKSFKPKCLNGENSQLLRGRWSRRRDELAMDGDTSSDEERWTREFMRVEIPLEWARHLEAYWASRLKSKRWEDEKGVTCLMHSAVLARDAFFTMSPAERLKWGTSTEDVARMATTLAHEGITPPAATSAATLPLPEANGKELVGRLVQRFWPDEGGWFDAIITDYRPTTNEHCLTYEINTPNETFEWADISQFDGQEFKLQELVATEVATEVATGAEFETAQQGNDDEPQLMDVTYGPAAEGTRVGSETTPWRKGKGGVGATRTA